MNKKMYVDVTEVCEDWGVSRAQGYKIIKQLNDRMLAINPKARRADGGNAGCVGEHGEGTDTERYNSPEEGQRDTNTTGATERIAELMREAEQREQSRERTSLWLCILGIG